MRRTNPVHDNVMVSMLAILLGCVVALPALASDVVWDGGGTDNA